MTRTRVYRDRDFKFKPTLKPMSAVMESTLKDIASAGGEVLRIPGGYWVLAARKGWNVGTSTIEALVSRGKLKYVAYENGRRGPFPVRAEVCQ